MVKRCFAAALMLWVQAVLGADPAPADTVRLKPVSPKPAPVVALTRLDRQAYKLEYNDRTVTLVHFWASWCTPCLQEMPGLQALQDRYSDNQLRVIAIAADSHNAVKKYISEHNINLEILIDQYGSALHAFNVKALPSSFVVNKEGKISHLVTGSLHWNNPMILRVIHKLLVTD